MPIILALAAIGALVLFLVLGGWGLLAVWFFGGGREDLTTTIYYSECIARIQLEEYNAYVQAIEEGYPDPVSPNEPSRQEYFAQECLKEAEERVRREEALSEAE